MRIPAWAQAPGEEPWLQSSAAASPRLSPVKTRDSVCLLGLWEAALPVFKMHLKTP